MTHHPVRPATVDHAEAEVGALVTGLHEHFREAPPVRVGLSTAGGWS